MDSVTHPFGPTPGRRERMTASSRWRPANRGRGRDELLHETMVPDVNTD
jgi:hypothetical protein